MEKSATEPAAIHPAEKISVEQTTSGHLAWLVFIIAAALVTLVLGFLSLTGYCPLSAVCGPVIDVDIVQARLDTALPAPRESFAYEQSFVANHNGLSEVELLLVKYDTDSAIGDGSAPLEAGQLQVVLLDDQGQIVARRVAENDALSHNETYGLHFSPQPRSAGRRYLVRLTGNDTNHYSAWGYSLDVYQPGELFAIGSGSPETAVRELRFTTRYTLGWLDALAELGRQATSNGYLIVISLLLVPLPGCLLLLAIRRREWEPAVWWGMAAGLGVAAWPVVWLWLTLAGGRWTSMSLWAVVGLGWVLVLGLWLWQRRGEESVSHQSADRRHILIANGLLLLLLIVTVSTRLLAVRDLAFPPWVDSSRHGLITAVMADQGTYPQDYEPYLPVSQTPYHYGFHTLPAGLLLMTGLPLPQLLLIIGQLLNGMLPLTIYAAGWIFTRNRGVALLAAFLVALPFYFPGYYATWGRMTQLAAVFVLPLLLAVTWRLDRSRSRDWVLAGVLAAGLFLLHFRVFMFYIPFAVLVALVHLLTRRGLLSLVKAGGLAFFLSLPRLVQLWREVDVGQTVRKSTPGYNALPVGYLTAGWERLYFGLAAAGLVIMLGAILMRKRWAILPLLLAAWVGSLFLLLSGSNLGLPETLVVNLNSMFITLFVPLSLFLAMSAGQIWQLADNTLAKPGYARWRKPVTSVAAAVLGGMLAVLAIFGVRQQIGILNPQTILAGEADLRALQWVAESLPEEAFLAVNSWQWSGSTWAGSDGGAWIVPVTGRLATTPPIDHIYNADLFAWVRAFNEEAVLVDDHWSGPEAADWLRGEDVTHIFVGERGGYLDPATLMRNPELNLIHQDGGVFIFELIAN